MGLSAAVLKEGGVGCAAPVGPQVGSPRCAPAQCLQQCSPWLVGLSPCAQSCHLRPTAAAGAQPWGAHGRRVLGKESETQGHLGLLPLQVKDAPSDAQLH